MLVEKLIPGKDSITRMCYDSRGFWKQTKPSIWFRRTLRMARSMTTLQCIPIAIDYDWYESWRFSTAENTYSCLARHIACRNCVRLGVPARAGCDSWRHQSSQCARLRGCPRIALRFWPGEISGFIYCYDPARNGLGTVDEPGASTRRGRQDFCQRHLGVWNDDLRGT